MSNAIETLQRNQRSQAAGMAATNSTVSELSRVLQVHETKINDINQTQANLHQQWMSEFDPQLEKVFVNITIAEQLRTRCDSLDAQLQSLLSFVHQTSRDEGRRAQEPDH